MVSQFIWRTENLQKKKSREICRFLLMFSTGFTLLNVLLFFLYQSPSWALCPVFGSISSNIDEVLSINPPDNLFAFEDFNVHHKDWLTYSCGTYRSGEFCYNFSITNNLIQMITFPTRIPDCVSHSPALLDLFLPSDASICSTKAFPTCCCLSFHWFYIIFITGCPVSSHSICLFSC